MKRNILLLLFVFFIPAVGVFVNCIMIGKDPKELPIGFVNHENDCSETFYRDSCEANLLGCYFMTVSVHLYCTNLLTNLLGCIAKLNMHTYCTEPVITLLGCIVQWSVHLYCTEPLFNLLGCHFMTVSVHLYCTEPIINLLGCIVVQRSVHLYCTEPVINLLVTSFRLSMTVTW